MAEPVGIIGTAVGIVSLGLQLYGSLKDYIDDVKGRDTYVSKTLENLEFLQQLLNSINSTLPCLEREHLSSTQTVATALRRCEAELKALEGEVQKHAPAATPSDRKGKMKETRKKLTFPFAKSELENLASRIDRLNSLLSLALQELEL